MILPHAITVGQPFLAWQGAVGLRGRPLIAIEGGSIALVGTEDDRGVSPEEAASFLDSVANLAANMACVPFRAGEPIDSETARRLLRAGERRFASLLSRLHGHDEWTLRLEWPSGAARLMEPKPGSYLERRRDELARAQGLDPVLVRAAAEVRRGLHGLIADSRLGGSAASVDLAVLLPSGEADRLMERASQEADRLGVACAIIGPWPAFSFAAESAV